MSVTLFSVIALILGVLSLIYPRFFWRISQYKFRISKDNVTFDTIEPGTTGIVITRISGVIFIIVSILYIINVFY
ncbi:DUF6199 family natural product biosynthesis protein [Cohnella endophytica]|uniref:DUF6199 family natural product biosynthesis protein n=1 Tax=Cohnella endophytica TaxID=2419778 RepID=UPI0011C3759A|nr:DUF6199 family natural product biosynthesis protein [Cohnella endophytica]